MPARVCAGALFPSVLRLGTLARSHIVIEAYHEALRAILCGDPSGYKALYSQAEDVTLANPFGGMARGRAEIEQRLDRAAANFRDWRRRADPD